MGQASTSSRRAGSANVLTCTSGRYDLALFVGHEVGLNGPRRAPAGDTMSVLDVERLVVLANHPR